MLFVCVSRAKCWGNVASLNNTGRMYSAINNIKQSNLINDIPPLRSELRRRLCVPLNDRETLAKSGQETCNFSLMSLKICGLGGSP